MKRLSLLLITCISILFFSCQKELNFTITDSVGTLNADITSNCLPGVIGGIYRVDSALSESNFIELQVQAITPGHYLILSDTLNGYSFKGEGTILNAGLNTIRVFAQGRPLTAKVDTFRINYGTSFCKTLVTVIPAGTGDAVYTLGGAPGTCTGATVQGVYQVGTPLSTTNTALINVNVTVVGVYEIAVPTTNGIQFTASGFFSTLGDQSVTLVASGTPINVGLMNVVASTITQSCSFTLDVLPSGAGSTAVFSLEATAGACNGAVLSGSYSAGVALNNTNTVVLNVNVTTIGSYNISTNVLNGISFSKSGTFTTTGVQPILLVGSGVPVTSGTYNFTASNATSNCTFSVTVTPGAPNLDYLPQTNYSNWTYALQGGTLDDTFHLQVLPNSIVKNGITYKIFEQQDPGFPTDSTFYRKTGSKYYMLYNMSLGFDNNFNMDGLILDSTLAVNATWSVNLGSNAISGVPITASYTAKILEKGATATFGSVTYSNIIKVKTIYYYNAGTGSVAYLEEETWYAKGYGIVFTSVNDVPVTATENYEIQRAEVF